MTKCIKNQPTKNPDQERAKKDKRSIENNLSRNAEVVVLGCSIIKGFLKLLQNSQKKSLPASLYNSSCRSHACNFIKRETSVQMLFCEF